jgi:hypothetical protein
MKATVHVGNENRGKKRQRERDGGRERFVTGMNLNMK